MEILVQSQNDILKILAAVCLVLGCFSLIIRYRAHSMKYSLVGVEFGAAALMIADLFAQYYNGDESRFGFYAVRTACFFYYFLINFEILAFNRYIICLITGRGKLKEPPKGLKVCSLLSLSGIALIAVSQFTGVCYTFDSSNVYRRGSLFFLFFLITAASFVFQLINVVRFRKYISSSIRSALIVFMILPVISAVLRVFMRDFSILNMSIALTAIFQYIVALVDQNNILMKSASTDALTGLHNQYGFLAAVDRVKEQHDIRNYNTYYIDIARMGQFNKRYGSDNGDLIIKEFGLNIAAQLEKDEILGRLGGNFFIALVNKDNSEQFLNYLREVPVKIKIGDEIETINVSSVAGGYEISDKHIVSEHVIGNAALAANIAKNVMKKPFTYLTQEILEKINESRQLEERIPAALKNGEFLPYYQPKVDVDRMELCGAEALARWEYDNSVVSPAKFIPVMEKDDSICRLDFYILDRVCKDVAGWIEQGLEPPCISVNFSRRNLGNPVLAEEIHNVVVDNNIPEKYIQVEITETIDEYPLSYLKGVVEALQGYGINVAIDDFGTGSSSINLLREISFDVLKIDRQFIECRSEKERKLLEHIINIAHDIDSCVIAEGVEQMDQIKMLKDYGCGQIQGYVFDKPLKKSEFEERMKRKKYG